MSISFEHWPLGILSPVHTRYCSCGAPCLRTTFDGMAVLQHEECGLILILLLASVSLIHRCPEARLATPTVEYRMGLIFSGGLRVALRAKSSRHSSLPTTSRSSDLHRSQFKAADGRISRPKRPDVLLGGLAFDISFPTSGSVHPGLSRRVPLRGIRKSARFAHMRTHHLLRLIRGSVP